MYDVFLQVKSNQAEIMRILESKSIKYELVDISVGSEVRAEMRSKAGDPTAAPPQLFNEDQYCGVRKTHSNSHAPNYSETSGSIHAVTGQIQPCCHGLPCFAPQNYEMFSEAVEADVVEQFLKMA